MSTKETQSDKAAETQEETNLCVITKYQLPSEEEMTKQLGPFDSEDKGLVITIINKILGKSQKYTDFLEEMLHPDSGIVSMQEASMFTNKEREEMFILFRELTLLQRKSLLIGLSTSEEEKAIYFKEFYSFFLTKKETLKIFIEKGLGVWSSPIDKNITQAYFG